MCFERKHSTLWLDAFLFCPKTGNKNNPLGTKGALLYRSMNDGMCVLRRWIACVKTQSHPAEFHSGQEKSLAAKRLSLYISCAVGI